ncbi:MAG: hypothetical protein AAF197_12030, partial [Pseudomonadota bacterium]
LDDELHTVAFDDTNSWLCSDPESIDILGGRDLYNKLQDVLQADGRTLRMRLPSLIEELQQAESRGREKAQLRRLRGAEKLMAERAEIGGARDGIRKLVDGSTFPVLIADESDEQGTARPVDPEPLASRDPKPLDEHSSILREAADIAARVFDAQLIIAQPAD